MENFQYASMEQSMEQCVVFAKEHRPDLKKYRLNIEEARKNVDVVKADKKPSVALTATTGWSSGILAGDDKGNVCWVTSN